MIIKKESSEDPGLSGVSKGTVACEHPAVGMILVRSPDREKGQCG